MSDPNPRVGPLGRAPRDIPWRQPPRDIPWRASLATLQGQPLGASTGPPPGETTTERPPGLLGRAVAPAGYTDLSCESVGFVPFGLGCGGTLGIAIGSQAIGQAAEA